MTETVSLLRQAADKLDALGRGWINERERGYVWPDAESLADTYLASCERVGVVQADWIATLHPGIAEPLAGLLRYVADDAEHFATVAEHTTVTVNQPSIDLARAIVGEEHRDG